MAQPNGVPKILKILMLHGYTQSGPLFHAKTRSLEKLLIKSLKPVTPILLYPTAPIQLLPAEIPGFDLSSTDAPDSWGWWKRETGGDKYVGLELGLSHIASTIRDAGGIDAVIGFSQGAAAAAMVASLLQPGRQTTWSDVEFPYPESWADLPALHPDGLKFAVCYSGFSTPNTLYKGFYEPKISCPTIHFIGSLDTVVEESRSLALAEGCADAQTVFHPGGHFVPVGKEMGGVVVGFIRSCCEEKVEESVEDMDMPF